ncbi:MAG TPA: glycosyltransferase family 39 protein [Vicinamibacteria bacterium]|nr:glycosyltransferase family 39 protein [Vicinamibacteria bacterium]
MMSLDPPLTERAAPDSDAQERAFLRKLTLYAFIIRALLAVLLHWSGFSRRLAPDEETYAVDGWSIALYWAGEIFVKPWRLTSDQPLGYFYLNGAAFFVFGHTEIPLKLVNAFLGALSCRFLYGLARELYGIPVAAYAARLLAYFPSLILWSVLNIRDAWVIALILLVSKKSLETVKGRSRLALAQLLLGAFALTFFRDYLFFVVAIPPVVAFLLGRSGHLIRNVIIASVAALGLLLLVQHGAVSEKTTKRMSLEALSEARQNLASGGSAFHGEVDVSTPGKALAFLPIGVAYFLFSPFPWEITSTLKLFSLPEMLFIYFLTPAILRGIRYAVHERFRESVQVLLLTGLLTVSYALGEGNVGTLYRHRAQALGFYLMFAALGREVSRAPQAAAPEPAEA